MLDICTCPTCGSKRIKRMRKRVTRMAWGKKYVMLGVEFHECPNGGDKVYGREALRKIETYRPSVKVAG